MYLYKKKGNNKENNFNIISLELYCKRYTLMKIIICILNF